MLNRPIHNDLTGGCFKVAAGTFFRGNKGSEVSSKEYVSEAKTLVTMERQKSIVVNLCISSQKVSH
jgi:hypothetical protein